MEKGDEYKGRASGGGGGNIWPRREKVEDPAPSCSIAKICSRKKAFADLTLQCNNSILAGKAINNHL